MLICFKLEADQHDIADDEEVLLVTVHPHYEDLSDIPKLCHNKQKILYPLWRQVNLQIANKCDVSEYKWANFFGTVFLDTLHKSIQLQTFDSKRELMSTDLYSVSL